MEHDSDLLTYLRQAELKNINLINFIYTYPIFNVVRAGSSVLVRSRSDRDWVLISSSSEAELKLLTHELDERDVCFAAIEDWMLPILMGDRTMLWDLATDRYYLPADVVLPQSAHETAPLSEADAQTIYAHSDYQQFLSMDYILQRIRLGFHCGIREAGQLLAWGMTQDDGAIGFLHVLETHRRKGYAYSISLALIEAVRQAGQLPFECIEEENANSIRLATKLGFKKDRKIHWFEVQ